MTVTRIFRGAGQALAPYGIFNTWENHDLEYDRALGKITIFPGTPDKLLKS